MRFKNDHLLDPAKHQEPVCSSELRWGTLVIDSVIIGTQEY